MTNWDEQIQKHTKEFQVPADYHEKVDKILDRLEHDAVRQPKKKGAARIAVALVVACLFLTGFLFASGAEVAQAGFLETFKATLLDFLGLDEQSSQNMGIESRQEEVHSKPDLMMELQEVVMDTQNIYAVVKIIAPTEIAFSDNMTFDYYGFCRGENYNVSGLFGGAKDCTLLEVSQTRPNIATFVVNIVTDEQVKEGSEVTVFFKDLISGYVDGEPQVLVEGMWSLSFAASYSEPESVTVKGTKEMQYTLVDQPVTIKKVRLMPLGMTLVTDVSTIPVDVLAVSDTRITIKLVLLDGREAVVTTPDADVPTISDAGSVAESEKNGHVYYTYVGQFDQAVDIKKVVGIWVEDVYISLLDETVE